MITTGHKLTLSVFFILISLSASAQSKNEQIQILTGKVDSLTTVSKQENLKFTTVENQLKTTINELKTTITEFKARVEELKASIQNRNETIKNLTLELANQKKNAAKKIDSLQALYTSLKTQANSDFNFITVRYANLVNGYKVKAAWRPVLVNADFPYMDRFVRGPAILEFSNTKDSVLFSVNADYFSLDKELFSITYVNTDSVDIASLNTTKITIQNKAQAQINRSTPLNFEDEFGFADVDFDGKKELIVREFGMGQRGSSTYAIYKIEDDENYEEVYKLRNSPFEQIDDETEFNYAAKTITISSFGGYCSSEYTTYSKKDYEFIPTTVVKTDTDKAGNCIQSTYKINITKNLQLLKKEVLKN